MEAMYLYTYNSRRKEKFLVEELFIAKDNSTSVNIEHWGHLDKSDINSIFNAGELYYYMFSRDNNKDTLNYFKVRVQAKLGGVQRSYLDKAEEIQKLIFEIEVQW